MYGRVASADMTDHRDMDDSNYLARGIGVRNIVISMPLCLFVCLSDCLSVLSHISETASPISQNFLHMLRAARLDHFSSGFVDDVMFSYNANNRPESKTTGMFRPIR